MPINWDLYEARVLANGATRRARRIHDQKQKMAELFPDAPYCHSCLIDGAAASLVILNGDNASQKKFYTVPTVSTSIGLGSLVFWSGSYWLVDRIDANTEISITGHLYECNLNLKFQLGTSTVYSSWCYFDRGVYSTTTKDYPDVSIGDQQFKILLPYTDNTKKLQRDKRIATEVLYFPNNTQQLRCYRITGADSVGNSFGSGKLLELKIREDQYQSSVDSVTYLICDYIEAGSCTTQTPGGGWA